MCVVSSCRVGFHGERCEMKEIIVEEPVMEGLDGFSSFIDIKLLVITLLVIVSHYTVQLDCTSSLCVNVL